MMKDIPEDVLRHWTIIDEIDKQTDRGAALIGAAYLEERLVEAIRSRFVAENVKKTVKPGRPLHRLPHLHSLDAKIDVAFWLGMIGEKARTDLRLIHQIRNKFAHVADPVSFDDQAIANLCAQLYFPSNIKQFDGSIPTTPRDKFLSGVYMLYNFLWTEMCKKKDDVPKPAYILP